MMCIYEWGCVPEGINNEITSTLSIALTFYKVYDQHSTREKINNLFFFFFFLKTSAASSPGVSTF